MSAYDDGWIDACNAFAMELRGIAPGDLPVVITADQVRRIIEDLRATAAVDTRPPLSPWQQRLIRYGIEP